MTIQVDFYVLGRDDVAAKHHHACRLVNEAHGRGLKVYLRTDDPQHSRLLDKMLWTFDQGSFVPHVVCDDARDRPHDINRYPVQIGHDDAPADCVDLLVSLRREVPADYVKFSRVAEVIIDREADKSAGRARFRFYRERGITPKTHKIP